jgi:hypothetical protein
MPSTAGWCAGDILSFRRTCVDLSADAIASFLHISNIRPRLCRARPIRRHRHQTWRGALPQKRLGAVHCYHPSQVGFFLQFSARENKGAEDGYPAKPLDFRIPPRGHGGENLARLLPAVALLQSACQFAGSHSSRTSPRCNVQRRHVEPQPRAIHSRRMRCCTCGILLKRTFSQVAPNPMPLDGRDTDPTIAAPRTKCRKRTVTGRSLARRRSAFPAQSRHSSGPSTRHPSFPKADVVSTRAGCDLSRKFAPTRLLQPEV